MSRGAKGLAREEEEERGGGREKERRGNGVRGGAPAKFSKNAILPPFRASLGPLVRVFVLLSPGSTFRRNAQLERTPGRRDRGVRAIATGPTGFRLFQSRPNAGCLSNGIANRPGGNLFRRPLVAALSLFFLAPRGALRAKKNWAKACVLKGGCLSFDGDFTLERHRFRMNSHH